MPFSDVWFTLSKLCCIIVGKNTNMPNPVTHKAEQHGLTLENRKYTIN